MKEIDRRGRTLMRLIMWGFWLQFHVFIVIGFCNAHEEASPTGFRILLLIISAGFTFMALYFGHYASPRAYFADEGVYLKRFIRKQLYPWSDMQQAVILERVGRSRHMSHTYYQFYLLTKEGSAWKRGDTEATYRWRNRRYLLLIPLTDESREYVRQHQVKLAIDQSKGKRILWRGFK